MNYINPKDTTVETNTIMIISNIMKPAVILTLSVISMNACSFWCFTMTILDTKKNHVVFSHLSCLTHGFCVRLTQYRIIFDVVTKYIDLENILRKNVFVFKLSGSDK